MSEFDLRVRISKLEKKVSDLQDQLAKMDKRALPLIPLGGTTPVYEYNQGCFKCGIGKDGGTMGYVCPRPDCPTRITC